MFVCCCFFDLYVQKCCKKIIAGVCVIHFRIESWCLNITLNQYNRNTFLNFFKRLFIVKFSVIHTKLSVSFLKNFKKYPKKF